MADIRHITLDDLKAIVNAMKTHGVDYVIFGGVALNIHNVPRETEDIDLFLRNTRENIIKFAQALKSLSLFDEIEHEELQALIDEGAFDYGVIRFGGEIGLDVATSMGTRTFDSLETQIVNLQGVELNVVTVQQLYEMKSTSLRARDMEDAARLRELRGADLR
jgi:hypothetical protein